MEKRKWVDWIFVGRIGFMWIGFMLDWIFVSYDLFLTAGHCPGKKFVKFLTLPGMHNYSFICIPGTYLCIVHIIQKI